MNSIAWLGTAVTALVGIAGVSATLWIAANARRTHDRQTLDADKRQTYAAMFARGDRVAAALKRVEVLRVVAAARAEEAVVDLDACRLELNAALYELLLVAPADVGEAATDLYYQYLDESERFRAGQEGHRPAPLAAQRRKLLNLMRHDLRRPPLNLRAAPSMTPSAAPTAAAFKPRPAEPSGLVPEQG